MEEHVVARIHNHENDVIKSWRCGKPKSSVYCFHVVSGPNFLYVWGDMGDYAWHRTVDMITWARTSLQSLDYFSEKLARGIVVKEDEKELLYQWSKDFKNDWNEHYNDCEVGDEHIWSEEHDEEMFRILRKYDETPSRDLVIEELVYSDYFGDWFSDCENLPNFEFYTFQYLWIVEGLKWFIQKLDEGDVIRA